jgi:hypothetical protein
LLLSKHFFWKLDKRFNALTTLFKSKVIIA